MPLSKEADAARMREQRELASEVMPNSRTAATSSAKLLRAKERIIDFKVNFHDYLRKKSCAIQRHPQQPFDIDQGKLVSLWACGCAPFLRRQEYVSGNLRVLQRTLRTSLCSDRSY